MNTRISLILAAGLIAAAPAVHAGRIAGAGETLTIYADGDDQESKADKEQDLYDEGTDALDEQEWSRAVKYFDRVAKMKMSHADAALFWKAHAQAKMGNRPDALATIAELQKWYPKSKWANDARQLEAEVRQMTGQIIDPARVEDEELKLMALNQIMQSDPERALPIVESILSGNKSEKLKEKALFVLSQSSSPKAMEVLTRIAKTGSPDLQMRAIRFLGIAGGHRAREVLADVYSSTNKVEVKKSVLKAYMLSGDRGHLLALAKGETNAELRAEAVTQLGVSGAKAELAELYSLEPTVEVKKKIIQAMFISGNSDKLYELARTEKTLELKTAAIRNLGLMGGSRTGALLVQMYREDTREEVREAVINGLFVQGNAKALVELARAEKDPELKREIVQKLSVMNSKDATEYLLEFLKD
jgi:hypothetical protein